MQVISKISSGFGLYGDGSNAQSAIVALGEGCAYYIGHFFADKRYGTTASCQSEQKDANGLNIIFCNTSGTNHPHLDVEENFNPHLTSDPFYWIPQGLFYDLWDPANETNPPNPVNDLVSGYTNAQLFSALQSDVTTLQAYQTRLISQTNNNPLGVNTIFSFYGY